MDHVSGGVALGVKVAATVVVAKADPIAHAGGSWRRSSDDALVGSRPDVAQHVFGVLLVHNC
eukprot:364404-Chlamydomonas_euryale.AAC.2